MFRFQQNATGGVLGGAVHVDGQDHLVLLVDRHLLADLNMGLPC